MRKKTFISLICAMILFLFLIETAISGEQTHEYKVVTAGGFSLSVKGVAKKSAQVIDEMSKDGWRLIFVTNIKAGSVVGGVLLYFERPIKDEKGGGQR